MQISRAMLGLYASRDAGAVDLAEMLQEILLIMERRLADLGVTYMPICRAVDGGWLPWPSYGRYSPT